MSPNFKPNFLGAIALRFPQLAFTLLFILAGETVLATPVLEKYSALAINTRSQRETGIPQRQIPKTAGAIRQTTGARQATLEQLQEMLANHRQNGDRVGEAVTLNRIGNFYSRQKNRDDAIASHQQALRIYRELNYREGEVKTFTYIGNAYFQVGEYKQVREFLQAQLEKLRKAGDRVSEEMFLKVMSQYVKGVSRSDRGLWYLNPAWLTPPENLSWQEMREITQLNLWINRETGDRKLEGHSLHSLGWIQHNLGHYARAMELYQKALEIARELNYAYHETFILVDIGVFYIDLGKYEVALEHFQLAQNLIQGKEMPDLTAEVEVLNKLGLVYKLLEDYNIALKYLNQSLSIYKSLPQNLSHQHADILNNLGQVYFKMGEYEKSLVAYQEALQYPSWNPSAKVQAINNVGLIYSKLGNEDRALAEYRKALAQFRALNDLPGERNTLSNIGALLERQERTELAIAFYKRSVNLTETIRANLQTLTREEQQAYTETVADTYRALANLLLSQGRILEAQQVLELLKVQELRNFTRNATITNSDPQLSFRQVERQILERHGTLIAFGQKVTECERTGCNELNQLLDQQAILTQNFNQEIAQLEREIRDRHSQDTAFLDPEDLGRKAQEIVEVEPGTVLIYPFVLDEKIWLLWAAQGGVTNTLEISVTQKELSATVLKFRQQLQNPNSNLKQLQATGKQLYDWLIQPLETELETNEIQNLVFSLDRATRYIPMSALFDGEKYLIETYTVSTVLSADLTDVRDRLPPGTEKTSVLAMGLSQAVEGFNSLPNVPDEIDGVVRTNSSDENGVYGGQQFLNAAFDLPTLRRNLRQKQILHLATHGDFSPGRAEESYLLLGTGDKLAIPDIQTLNLRDVHLVVLSACETALGGEGREGVEINGISYYFLNRGAKAVMASLWLVNDASTSQLMQQFYRNLARGTAAEPMTKAEALRQAQLQMLRGEAFEEEGENRGLVAVRPALETGEEWEESFAEGFSHPYYWAPFILIGNGF